MTQSAQPITVGNAIMLANEHLKARRLADAELIYRQVLAVNSKNFDALHFLGVIAIQVRKYDKAAELIRRATEQNPSSYAAHNNLGIAYMQQGRLAEADQCFKQALALKPDYSQAKINRGRICQKLGDHATGLEMTLQGTGFARFTQTKVQLLSKLVMCYLADSLELLDISCDFLQYLACA